jgi:hypothetical protein
MSLKIILNPLSGNFDFVGDTGAPAPALATRYTALFNNTTDWTLSSPDYLYTVLASSHGKGTTPNIQVFESLGGGSYEQVIVNISINNLGDVTLKISETPNNRFNGLILII